MPNDECINKEWDRMQNGGYRHEEGHVHIIKYNWIDAHEKFLGKDWDSAQKILEKMKEKTDKDNEREDLDTNHGETEGAYLNTDACPPTDDDPPTEPEPPLPPCPDKPPDMSWQEYEKLYPWCGLL